MANDLLLGRKVLIKGAHRLQQRRGMLQRLPGLGGALLGRLQRLGLLPGAFLQCGQGGLCGLQGVPVFGLLFAQGRQGGEHAVQGGGAQCPVEPVPVRLESLHFALQGVRLRGQGNEFPVQVIDGGPPGNGPGGGCAAGNAVHLLLLLILESLGDGLFLGRLQGDDARGLCLEECQFFPLGPVTLVHAHGDPAVDLGAGDLFEDRRPIIRGRLQEGGKVPLGEQHGAGEAVEIHACDRLDQVGHPGDGGIEDLAGVSVGQLAFRRLEVAGRSFVGSALAPGAAVTARIGGKAHLGKAFAGVTGHDLVAALGDLVQPRGASVQGQADGVEDGGLARAGGPGDGEDAVSRVGRDGQVDAPLANQGVQVQKPDIQDSHRNPPYSARRSSSWSDESVSR